MDRSTFDRFVCEFPFLTKIVAQESLSADSIAYIEVKKGDRNLLEVKPGGWANDAGGYGEHSGHRHFWFVAPGELEQLIASWWRTQVPHGTTASQDTDPIGAQLLRLNRDVQFIVEVHEECWDWEESTPDITIYKMQGFDWRCFVRPIQTR